MADNMEVRNIKAVTISNNKNVKILLLHDKDNSLVKRIKLEQLRKNIN